VHGVSEREIFKQSHAKRRVRATLPLICHAGVKNGLADGEARGDGVGRHTRAGGELALHAKGHRAPSRR